MTWIDDAYKQFHRLWSVQASLFFAMLNGAVLGLAAFVNTIDPWTFLYLNVAGYVLIALLRLIKQRPAPEVPSSMPKSTALSDKPWTAPDIAVTAPLIVATELEAQEIFDALKKLIQQHPSLEVRS
jgi:hypothetical protein